MEKIIIIFYMKNKIIARKARPEKVVTFQPSLQMEERSGNDSCVGSNPTLAVATNYYEKEIENSASIT